jgi:type II secretory pathway component GspD/PulD (secretin)
MYVQVFRMMLSALILGGLLTCHFASANKTVMIPELEFKQAKLINVIRLLSETSGKNIVVTPEASEAEVSIYLRNVTLRQAIETICRINNLWYRFDQKARTYRIMTNEEYSRDLIIDRDSETKVFTLKNPNIEFVANAIKNLYGNRVKRSDSDDDGDDDDDNDNDNDNSFNSNDDSSNSSSQTDQEDRVQVELSVDQISNLQQGGIVQNKVSAAQLQKLSIQKEPIFVTTISEHNLVVVRTGDDEVMKSIIALIEDIDRPVPQVLLEMKIMDVLVGDDFNSVFNFELSSSALTGDSTKPILLGNNALISGSFVFEYLNDRLKANVEFLEKDNRVNVLSTPTLLATNNRSAKLFVGDEQLLVTGYSAQEVNVAGNQDVTVVNENIVPSTAFREIGNTIEITPYINADRTITLELKQESSSIKRGATNIPVVTNTQVLSLPVDTVTTAVLEGTVIAKDGLTIAIGGLVRETTSMSEQKVPFFSDIPGIGYFFKSIREKKERSELILMITPRVMMNPEDKKSIGSPLEIEQFTMDSPNIDNLPDNFRCRAGCRL